MPGPDFLDTNVLVYAYDVTEPAKQAVAQDLVRRAVAGRLVISTQALAEFAATLLHKLIPAPSSEDVVALLDTLAPIRLIPPITTPYAGQSKPKLPTACIFTTA